MVKCCAQEIFCTYFKKLEGTFFPSPFVYIMVNNSLFIMACIQWNITYVSANFCVYIVGVNLKILKCEKSCPGVPLLVDWLKGAFDALEKKYVRKLYLLLRFITFSCNYYSMLCSRPLYLRPNIYAVALRHRRQSKFLAGVVWPPWNIIISYNVQEYVMRALSKVVTFQK